MSRLDRIRHRIEASDVESGRSILLNMARLVARRRIVYLARDNYVIDFSDSLVEQALRDERDAIKTQGQNVVTNINNATTVSELLTLFDQIRNSL